MRYAMIVIFVVLLSGCNFPQYFYKSMTDWSGPEHSLTLITWNKLEPEMPQHRVIDLLGKDWEMVSVSGEGDILVEHLYWESGRRSVNVIFVNKRLHTKSKSGF